MDNNFSSLISAEDSVRVCFTSPNESPVLVGSDCTNKFHTMFRWFRSVTQLNGHFTTLRKHYVLYINNMQLAICITQDEEFSIEGERDDWIIVPGLEVYHLHPVPPQLQNASSRGVSISLTPKSQLITVDADTKYITWSGVTAEELSISTEIHNF